MHRASIPWLLALAGLVSACGEEAALPEWCDTLEPVDTDAPNLSWQEACDAAYDACICDGRGDECQWICNG